MEAIEKINSILQLEKIDANNSEDVCDILRSLRNMCAEGSDIQNAIASNSMFQEFLSSLLFTIKSNECDDDGGLIRLGWQLLANITVRNKNTQIMIWQIHGEHILNKCFNIQEPLNRNYDIMAMIIYNVFKYKPAEVSSHLALIFRAAVCIWQAVLQQKCKLQFEFLHFIFEEFLAKDGRTTVKYYTQLSIEERLAFLDYLVNYLRQDSPNGLVHDFILQHISKEFKMKSDCILRVSSGMQEIDKIIPKEVYALLMCIASASGSDHYLQVYEIDHALFLNVAGLLRCVMIASKNIERNIFTPMNKLEEVAPSSTISADYQSEISYELKTLLIRCIANLLYKNALNKAYSLDIHLMPFLFECTNMDARNPLMKEWSILAIRNACDGCPEIQKIISNLTEQGQAQNDLLTELNLEFGSMRINPGRE